MTPSLPLSGRIVEAEVLRRPVLLKQPLRGARGVVTTRAIRLVTLKADDGFEGIGEGSSVDWLAASPSSARAGAGASVDARASSDASVLRSLVEYIRRERPTADELLEWSIDSSAPPAVRSAVQTALLDLEARRSGITMARLLGAASDSPLPVSALVGNGSPEEMARETEALLARGLACFKLKVGSRDLSADAQRVAAVRAVAREASLRLDANGAWSLDEAARAIDALAPADFLEEPLADASACGRLRTAMRIALDESVEDMHTLETALASGGFQVLVVKLERVGGPLAALSLAEHAKRAQVEVIFTDSIESAVGRAATVHVAAAAYARAGTAASAVGLGGRFVLEDPLDEAPRGTDLALAQVRGPGCGIDIARLRSGKPS